MAKNKNKQHRFKVYTDCDFSCVYCGKKFIPHEFWDKKEALHDGVMFLELDHIIPLSKGGTDNIENKQALCGKCNNKKSDKKCKLR